LAAWVEPGTASLEAPSFAGGIGQGVEAAAAAGLRGLPRFRLAVAAARRARIVVWLCAIGAISTFATYLPVAFTPEPLAWLVGLASHWQWAYAGLALVGSALALGSSSSHRNHVLMPLGIVAVAWLHQSPGAKTLTSADTSMPASR
jgi:hypothetical protein